MSEQKTVWAVVPAGGSGSRFSSSRDKLLAEIAGVPVLVRTLCALLECQNIDGIVLVAGEQNIEAYQALINAHFIGRPIRLTTGGASRRESVYQGLQALPDDADVVVVHDAARPLFEPGKINEALSMIWLGAAGVVLSVPMRDTVKFVDESWTVKQTLNRDLLWRVQTPQVFLRTLLTQAHEQVPPEAEVTDDAQLLEMSGLGPVMVVEGQDSNLKITTEADIRLAEAYLAAGLTGEQTPV